MGTRSVIARQQGDGWKGRYCHWDGYPSNMLVELLRIVNVEHGGDHEAAMSVLNDEHYGWSGLSEKPDLGPGHDDGRFVAVPGHGVAYTEEQGQSSPDMWVTHDGDDCGTEWAYALNGKGIAVFQNVYPGWKFVGFVNYDAEIPAELLAT